MPISFRFDQDLKVIFSKGYGVVTVQDLQGHGKNILAMNMDLTGVIEYVDYSEVTDIMITYNIALQMRDGMKQWQQLGIVGTIHYAPSDLCYGISRMMHTVLASANADKSVLPVITRNPVPPEQIRTFLIASRM